MFTDKTVIEVMTNYGENYRYINRSLLIDEPILAEHALHSKELQRYLAGKEKKQKKKGKTDRSDSRRPNKNVTNVELKHDNIIRAVSHAPQQENLGVKLEEWIKENNKKKEEAEKKKKKEEEKMQKKE